jgi:hypothetical protein
MGWARSSSDAGYRLVKHISNVVGKLLGKWSLGRPKKWEDNIKMHLVDVGCGDGR